MKTKKGQFIQINFPRQKEHQLDLPEQKTREQPILQEPTGSTSADPHYRPVSTTQQLSPDQSFATSGPSAFIRPQTFLPGGFVESPAPLPLSSVQRWAAPPPQPLQRSPVPLPGMSPISPEQGFPGRGQASPLPYHRLAYEGAYDRDAGLPSWPGPRPGVVPARKKRRIPIWGRVILTILLLVLIAIATTGGYYYYIFSNALNGVTGQQLNRPTDDQPGPGHRVNNGGILDGGRFNILLLGSDTDYKTLKVNGGALAQVDIVVTIDPASKTVGMLSIPRDSWLHVPGYGLRKLDQAYLLGGGGKGGVELTSRTIHQDFGIYIDHYAWVGLDGFIKVINTVGGVDVDVIHPIVDDAYPDDIGDHGKDIYAVKRLSLAPGPQHLDGQQALEYVRSRHADLNGDFGRSARQQQVLNQLKTKLNNSGIMGRLPELANDLKGSVMTDLNLPDVVTLMNFARSLDPNKIKRVTLGPPYSEIKSIDTDAGLQSVVFLHCDQILPIITPMFGSQAKCDNGYMISSATPLAAYLQPSPALNNGVQVSSVSTGSVGDIWQLISQLAAMSAMNSAGSDLPGVHCLLDLLFLGVFESPAALQI